jgi:putative addiction module killer protein
MEAQPREIKIYVTEDEGCPFELWFQSLRDRNAKARIRSRIDRVEMGNLGDFKSVGDGVFELRIDYGPGYRVYFAQQGEAIILLLCGGDKSSQSSDILIAKQYWNEFQQR